MQRVLLAAAVAMIASAAQADALYGKAEAFKARAYGLFQANTEAMVASRCGLRSEAWRVQVGRAVDRRITAMAQQVWPDPHAPARFTALVEVGQDLDADLETTLQTMTQNDCETLRSEPAEMRHLDDLAAEGAR